jgi:hypothetical protein
LQAKVYALGTRIRLGLGVRVTFAEEKEGKVVEVWLKGARGKVRFVHGHVKALLKEKDGCAVLIVRRN